MVSWLKANDKKMVLGMECGMFSVNGLFVDFSERQPRYVDSFSFEIKDDHWVEELFRNAVFASHKPAMTGLAIGATNVDIRYLLLPSLSTSDLQGMVEMEMKKRIDYRIEEACVDYTISGEMVDHRDNHIHVIAFSTPRYLVQRILDAFSANNRKVSVVDVAPMALLNLYRHLVPHCKERTIVGIDIGENTITIALGRNGLLMFTRNFPVSASLHHKKDGDVGPLVAELAQEIQHTIEFCRMNILPVECDEVFLSGARGGQPELPEALTLEIGIPCQTIPLDFGPYGDYDSRSLGNAPRSHMAIAAGLCLRLGKELL
jgi:Tfp pilus assembly PilM family ATPase